MEFALLGFLTGLSLILAIGAQNVFVIEQGLKKQHVFLVCLIRYNRQEIITPVYKILYNKIFHYEDINYVSGHIKTFPGNAGIFAY